MFGHLIYYNFNICIVILQYVNASLQGSAYKYRMFYVAIPGSNGSPKPCTGTASSRHLILVVQIFVTI